MNTPSKRVCSAMLLLFGLGLMPAHTDETSGDTKAITLPGVDHAAESAADKVYITSQPTQETFDELAKKGVKVVINLRRPEETAKLSFDEAAAAKNLGMEYIKVPMGTGLPNNEQVKLLMETLSKSKESPVLLHCASGNRSGAIWALYSGVGKKLPLDAAIAEGECAGMTNAALEHVVRNRITAETAKP